MPNQNEFGKPATSSVFRVNWLARLSAPSFRYAMAAMLFCIIGAFAFEYTSAYVSLTTLEKEIRMRDAALNDTAEAGMSGNLLNAAEDVSKLMSGKRSFVKVSDNWVVINKASLHQLMQLYVELKNKSSALPPEFHKEHPRLSALLNEKDPSVQFSVIMKERELLIRELNRIMPQEGIKP